MQPSPGGDLKRTDHWISKWASQALVMPNNVIVETSHCFIPTWVVSIQQYSPSIINSNQNYINNHILNITWGLNMLIQAPLIHPANPSCIMLVPWSFLSKFATKSLHPHRLPWQVSSSRIWLNVTGQSRLTAPVWLTGGRYCGPAAYSTKNPSASNQLKNWSLACPPN